MEFWNGALPWPSMRLLQSAARSRTASALANSPNIHANVFLLVAAGANEIGGNGRELVKFLLLPRFLPSPADLIIRVRGATAIISTLIIGGPAGPLSVPLAGPASSQAVNGLSAALGPLLIGSPPDSLCVAYNTTLLAIPTVFAIIVFGAARRRHVIKRDKGHPSSDRVRDLWRRALSHALTTSLDMSTVAPRLAEGKSSTPAPPLLRASSSRQWTPPRGQSDDWWRAARWIAPTVEGRRDARAHGDGHAASSLEEDDAASAPRTPPRAKRSPGHDDDAPSSGTTSLHSTPTSTTYSPQHSSEDGTSDGGGGVAEAESDAELTERLANGRADLEALERYLTGAETIGHLRSSAPPDRTGAHALSNRPQVGSSVYLPQFASLAKGFASSMGPDSDGGSASPWQEASSPYAHPSPLAAAPAALSITEEGSSHATDGKGGSPSTDTRLTLRSRVMLRVWSRGALRHSASSSRSSSLGEPTTADKPAQPHADARMQLAPRARPGSSLVSVVYMVRAALRVQRRRRRSTRAVPDAR